MSLRQNFSIFRKELMHSIIIIGIVI